MAGMAGMAVMADGMVGWQGRNGRLAQMDTYVLFTQHTDDDDDDDDTNTLIFYSIDKPIGALPGRDYVLMRMVINNLVLYTVRNGTSKKGGNAPRATD